MTKQTSGDVSPFVPPSVAVPFSGDTLRVAITPVFGNMIRFDISISLAPSLHSILPDRRCGWVK